MACRPSTRGVDSSLGAAAGLLWCSREDLMQLMTMGLRQTLLGGQAEGSKADKHVPVCWE